MSNLPQPIRDIQDQLGRGLSGAMCYVGASNPTYLCRDWTSASKVRDDGTVHFDVGLCFQVNGKRGQGWRIIIAVEPCDTYTVRLWRKAKPSEVREGKLGVVMTEIEDVYCDTLKQVVEKVYDDAIREHNGGFINLS